MIEKRVFPVVHHQNHGLTVEQASLALSMGAAGVFLISHGGRDDELLAPATELKRSFPSLLIGANFLSLAPEQALSVAMSERLDMVWCDAPGVTSEGLNGVGMRIGIALQSNEKPCPEFFGSVAFKYQPHESDPGTAALFAHRAGMVPTTSGLGTGSPPSVGKVSAMRSVLPKGARLAVASGMTPENVGEFLPYISDFLVSTGISLDAYRFDKERMKAFIEVVGKYSSD